ncbi:protocadherin alpha-C2-like [Protopterus annectens]|uniref:protocadherin alpha-C2-like n=1 Tax=Protopterus annectens TaxID=7888 RepID=UPI001CF9393D|nr:protocadherin alpha-C2-like [Protopterus annectens]
MSESVCIIKCWRTDRKLIFIPVVLKKKMYCLAKSNPGIYVLLPLSIWLSCCMDQSLGDILFSVPEELQPGTLVGNIENAFGLRITNMSDRRFRLVSGDSKPSLFTIFGNGSICVNERIDREAICGIKTPCYINMKLVMDNPLELYSIKLEVQDVNDNAPTFHFDDWHLNIMESVPVGTKFTLQAAGDSDVGSNGLQSYRLSHSSYFSLDIKHSNDKLPQLVLEKYLDREHESVHRLSLTAIDGGQPERSGSVSITINILDANDNSPKFDQSVYQASLMEDAAVGTLIIQLRATDLDEGTNGAFEYSFSSHTPDNIRGLFEIHPTTGDILLKTQMEFEEITTYEFYVQATDKGPFALSDHSKVLIDIVDVNNNKPNIILTSFKGSVSENAPRGTVVGLISVTDRDFGINAYVTCRISDNSPFVLRAVEDYYILETTNPLDRESVASYNVTITATDSGIPPLSSETFVFVEVADVNDTPPQFTEASYRCFIAENNSPGEGLCRVKAIDPDLGENCKVAYSIVEHQMHGVSVFSYISIDSENGLVSARTIFDYEKVKNLELTIIGKDQGNPSLNSTAKLLVIVIDENDNNPTFLYPPVSVGNVPIEMIPRSAEAGFLVTKVITVDEDSGQNAWLSYQLLHSTDVSLFDIDKQTGEIRIVRTISAKDNSRQKLVVEVKDNGTPMRSATVTIGLLLYDNFPQVLPDFKEPTESNEKVSSVNLVLIIIIVAISFLFLGLLIIFTTISCCRTLNSGTCYCPLGCCLEELESYKLKIPGPSDCTLQNNLMQIVETGTLLHGYNYTTFLGQVSPSRKVFLRNSQLEPLGNNAIIAPGCGTGGSEKNEAEVCNKV